MDYIKLIKQRLTDKRFKHSIEVANRGEQLAKIHNVDKEKVRTACLLHDCCKCMSNEQLLQMLRKYDIILDSVLMKSTSLWHSLAGYLYCKEVLKISDEDILNGVKYHTSGRAAMSEVEKVVYLADLTSLDRTYDDVEDVRKMCDENLDKAMLYSLQFSISDLMDKKMPVSIDTIKGYNYFLAKKSNEN